MQYNIEQLSYRTFSSLSKESGAFVLGKLAQSSLSDIIYIASSGVELSLMSDLLEYMYPTLEVLRFPAWDTVPYDRTSPNSDIIAKRVETLSQLALCPTVKHSRIIVTSLGAALQKLPPKKVFLNAIREIKVGQKLEFGEFLHYASINGYTRTEQVFEAGEYAVRGDIIDIFPIGTKEPLRIDLFDDEVERIRTFDVMTQRTSGVLDSYCFRVVSEVVLDDKAVAAFRGCYREAFGAEANNDEIYAAVSEKHKYIGMENWLPFFYNNQLVSLFDYLPQAHIITAENLLDALKSKTESIADYYTARLQDLEIKPSAEGEVYRPVAPELLYLSEEDFSQLLQRKNSVSFTSLNLPASDAVCDYGFVPMRLFAGIKNIALQQVYQDLQQFLQANTSSVRIISCYSAGSRERIKSLLQEHAITDLVSIDSWDEACVCGKKHIALITAPFEHGFKGQGICLVAEADILGEKIDRHKQKKYSSANFIADISTLTSGELVVHIEHGLGRFVGLETLVVDGAPHDCLKIEYAKNSKLFVPVENINVLSRYGNDNAQVELDELGGTAWSLKKARVKNKIHDMAEKLIKIAAARQLQKAEIFSPVAGLYGDFCARFPYSETDDQLNAIADVISDLEQGRPMDRLICGDVGFGKTEVAMRAAFVVASSGAQVAVIVPTTLLARQHYQNFCQRFAGFPINIRMLSRLVTAKESAEVIQGLKSGAVDVVIGTHALLSQKVEFGNLGLLIIDEEQHFGVAHKEKLKTLKNGVHVLTLTATPIPRTLQLSLTGVKQLSVIATPPVDRLAARSFVLPFDKVMIKEAILREKHRGGQTFYVCPKIADIPEVERVLSEMVPDVKVLVAHGQMSPSHLEDVMSDFASGSGDILLSTTIIESGIDMPRVNTMIIHRADMFGLAQLYQLKGRIGRSKIRGYAYFTVQKNHRLRDLAQKRLQILQSLDSLGAGFSLASYDMDLRGSGNLLGEEQSGHIKDVGISLYQHMLEEEIARLKAENSHTAAAPKDDWAPQIAIGIPILIPESYVGDLGLRLGLYKRIGDIDNFAAVDDMKEELIDRFGQLPLEVSNLLTVVEIKIICQQCGIDRINAGAKGILLGFHNNTFAYPERLIAMINKSFGAIKIRPDQRLLIAGDFSSYETRVRTIKQYISKIAELLH
ncbi:MAG: transcription-repair coupling factor [Alphaproteobacteria bacterium]|nr:transcription-repair coupling factor [Alphaproteobacteria bacterium]